MTDPSSPRQPAGLAIDQAAEQAIAHRRQGQRQVRPEEDPPAQEIETLLALFSEGRYAPAAVLAQSMTVRFPLHMFGWKALGAVFQRMGRNADALAPMQTAATLSPGDAEAHNNLGNTLVSLGRLDEAEMSYRQALRIRPDFAEAHFNLGNTLKDLRRLDEAEAGYRRALEIKRDFAEAHCNLGNTLLALGRLDAAESSYRRALHIKPDYADAHYNLRVVLRKLGRPDAAGARAGNPSPEETRTLVALFTEARYAEAATRARTMTAQFPLHAFGWKALGAVFKQMGRNADALTPTKRAATLSPNDAEAHNTLGAILQELGRPDEAEASCREALRIKPEYAEAHYNLGITLQNLGRPDEAEASYRRALQIRPDYADAFSNLGNTLLGLGRLDAAETSYRRALQVKRDCVEAHFNLGNTLLRLGRLDAAATSYRRALGIKPEDADAHFNLGVALQNLGRSEAAEASYRRALRIKPNYAEVLNNLALLFSARGNAMMALDIVKQSLQIKETAEAKCIFVDCVRRLPCTAEDSEFRVTMVRALTEPWGRPSDLARSGIDLVKLNADIGGCVARAAEAWPVRLSAQDLFGSNGLGSVASDQVLHALLDSAPICDIEMERFLTMARRGMLEAATAVAASEDGTGPVLGFYSALARQCFINEYVYSYTEDEIRKAGALRDSLIAALDGRTQVPFLWPIAVAAYFPLYSLPPATRLLETQWPEAVTAVLRQQVREPAEELQGRAGIPRLTNIDDEVSLLVQNQYEENPFPRWVSTAPAKGLENFVAHLCQKFPFASFKRYGNCAKPDILIAGCGTGQHSIETARTFPGARVLAVDLSMGSLAYAARKTREMGLTSIEYAQADLLELGSIGRSFDVVESVGVLHHLADPWMGWRVLLSVLRPGGFMRLGFYSELGRRNLVRMQAFIAERGYGATGDEIRRFRQDWMDLDKTPDFGTASELQDFFTTSTCRDLLFHVQERRMTLAAIDVFLRENALVFLGFEIDAQVLGNYTLRFPDDRAATDLGQWQVFENENPDTFFGMYQFWIQKAG